MPLWQSSTSSTTMANSVAYFDGCIVYILPMNWHSLLPYVSARSRNLIENKVGSEVKSNGDRVTTIFADSLSCACTPLHVART